jgi:hypothetical protein
MMQLSDAGEYRKSWRLMLETKVDEAREFSCAAAFSDDIVDRDPDANLESGASCILK